MSAETDPQTFNDLDGQIHVLFNSMASSVAEASARRGDLIYMQRELGALALAYPHRINFITTAEKPEETHDRLLEQVDEGDAIVAAGGDGLMHLVVNFLRRHPELSPALRDTLTVPIFAGNANLTASELNPKHVLMRPHIVDILRDGVVIDAYGSTTTVSSDHPDEIEPDEWDNVACHSLQIGGLVSLALAEVKANWLRKTFFRTAVDGKATMGAVKESELIEMLINGESVETIGSIGVNTRPYLKHVNTPANLAEQAFYELTLTDQTLSYLLSTHVKNWARHSIPWRRVGEGESLTYEITAQPGQQLYAEGDAEAHGLPVQDDAETRIKVVTKPFDTPSKMLTTNPRLIDLAKAA